MAFLLDESYPVQYINTDRAAHKTKMPYQLIVPYPISRSKAELKGIKA